ncbi:MAG: hypothetical protein ACXABY_07265 [Candidatus Thorarchaeota archaeon]|jgi:hypothetical protein
MANIMEILFGQKERIQNLNPQTAGQQDLHAQLLQALQGAGAGGGFGEAADYYRDLLSGDSETQQQMEAPLQRQFQEETIPGLATQFAGMGSGGLSSSAFRNAGVRAGTDLSERLGAIRAGLRQQGAAGLTGMAQQGLQPIQEQVIRPQTMGLIGGAAETAGKGAGMAMGFGARGMMGGM